MIRPLGVDELGRFRAIRREALASEPDAFGETLARFDARSDAEMARWFAACTGAERGGILVAEEDGEAVGVCGWGVRDDDAEVGTFWGLFVSPRARRVGVGRALLRRVRELLAEAGAPRVRACVAAPNEGALAFYRAAGFIVGPRTGWLRDGSDVPVRDVSGRTDGRVDELETERLVLRELRETDRDAYVDLQRSSDAEFRRWSPRRKGGPESWFEADLRRSRTGRSRGTGWRWAAFLEDGRMVGFFSLNEVVRRAFQSAYAGWSVGTELTGRGYATEGVRALLDLAFSPGALGLHRVQANVVPENAASLRVADKVGFRREGHASRYLRIAGEWRDHVMFARTVEEHVFRYLEAP